MATKVTINLPDSLYERTQRLAHRKEQGMDEVISTLIEAGLAAQQTDKGHVEESVADSVVEREREAYIALHPTLKEKFLGKYVAIYQGKMIDHDDDPAMLRIRTAEKHPNEFVLLARVGPEPMRTIDMRSPRIVRDTVS